MPGFSPRRTGYANSRAAVASHPICRVWCLDELTICVGARNDASHIV